MPMSTKGSSGFCTLSSGCARVGLKNSRSGPPASAGGEVGRGEGC